MAGAGYKLFNTGDVLTAAQVNTYLQEQTVMVFADATARTTALSGVLAEGMVTYLKSTKVVEIYNGTAWASLDDPNAIQNTIVDAKGDLISATANDTPARLAVGDNGETLVADSSQTTGLRWGNNYGFTAGKNKIINGDFRINQRGFTSTTTTATYGFDRFWLQRGSGGTVTYSAQTFTAGTAPVAGYEAINYARLVTASQSASTDYSVLRQSIEDVRTCANQTVTISAWIKAANNGDKANFGFAQIFGTGGSAEVYTKGANLTLTTSWVRYSTTFTIPSISGKTIGTNNCLIADIWTSAGSGITTYSDVGNQNTTVEIWGVQVEIGSVATAFQTATGTLAGELAACQRYYVVFENGAGIGVFNSTTQMERIGLNLPAVMRSAPTVSLSGSILWYDGNNTGTATSLSSTYSSKQYIQYGAVAATGTSAQYRVAINYINAATGNIIASAEL